MAAPDTGRFKWVADVARWFVDARRLTAPLAVPARVVVQRERPAAEGDPLVAAVQSRVAEVLRGLLGDLGLRGRPQVDVAVERPGPAGPLRFSVNGRPCRPSAGQLGPILGELAPDAAGDPVRVPDGSLPDVVAAACAAVLRRRPSLLATDHQLDLVLFTAGRPPGSLDPRLAAALRRLLDNGIGVGDTATLLEVVREADPAQSAAELAEALIDRLRPPTLDVLLPEATLRRATTAQPVPATSFSEVRGRLLQRLGVQPPDLRLVVDDSLPPGTCALRINHLTTWPRPVPQAAPLDALYARIEEAATNNAYRFLAVSTVRQSLDQLGLAFPDRVGQVTDRYPMAWLSAVLRCLVEEAVPIDDLITSMLLDWLLDLDDQGGGRDVVRLPEGPADPARAAPLPAPRDVVAYVRQRAWEDAWSIAPGDATLPVHRLADALVPDDAAGPDGWPQAAAVERLTDAVRALRPERSPGIPLVVSSLPGRARVREALAAEFPELTVVASQELPPWVRLVPVPQG